MDASCKKKSQLIPKCPPAGTKKGQYYKYYDTPDGCDVGKKVLVCARYGAITGLIASFYDVLMYTHAKGFGPVLGRIAYHTVPLTLMGVTFAAVTNTVLLARRKDDQLNYFLGGLVCGPILAYYLKSGHAVLLGGMALGVSGMIKKYAIDTNTTIFPNVQGHMGMVDSWRHDYTFVEDPKCERKCGDYKCTD